MKEDLVEQLKVKDKWYRGLFMILFVVLLGLVETLVFAITAFQFIHVLVTGSVNAHLVPMSRQVVAYMLQICQFLTYQSEDKPFPFGEFPDAPSGRPTSPPKKPKVVKGK